MEETPYLDIVLHYEISGNLLTALSVTPLQTIGELKVMANESVEEGVCVQNLLLLGRVLADRETIADLELVTGSVLTAVTGIQMQMQADGRPILGFMTEEHRQWLVAAVDEELVAIGADPQNLVNWQVSAVASIAADQPKLPHDFKAAFADRGDDDVTRCTACAHVFVFRTIQGYIAGAFRIGFAARDEHAFVFSLVRPAGIGKRGVPFVPGSVEVSSEPVKLKVRHGSEDRAIYTGGNARFCFGNGSTGQSDFNFNSLVPFVCSNLLSYGPLGVDPVLLFGGGESATNGDRFEYRPDIMLAYQVPIVRPD